MRDISPADPTWSTTFPHLVVPREGEGLTGLLLRCDEANLWGASGMLSYLLDSTSKRKLALGAGQLEWKHLEKLASALALPLSTVVATTYRRELFRLYGVERSPGQPGSWPVLVRLCPVCVAESQMLARTLDLPGVTFCPRHQAPLVERWKSGSPLLPFHPYALPFTCYACGLPWTRLSPPPGEQEEIVTLGQKWLAYYEFFFTQGTTDILASAFRLVSDRLPETRESGIERSGRSLASLIRDLVKCNLTVDDILRQAQGQ